MGCQVGCGTARLVDATSQAAAVPTPMAVASTMTSAVVAVDRACQSAPDARSAGTDVMDVMGAMDVRDVGTQRADRLAQSAEVCEAGCQASDPAASAATASFGVQATAGTAESSSQFEIYSWMVRSQGVQADPVATASKASETHGVSTADAACDAVPITLNASCQSAPPARTHEISTQAELETDAEAAAAAPAAAEAARASADQAAAEARGRATDAAAARDEAAAALVHSR